MSADQQAHDVVGPLHIDAVLVIKGGRNAFLLVALVAEEPAARGVDHHAIREGIRHLDRDNRRKRVGGVFFPSENRESEFADQRVAGLMREHEQHVPGHELGAVLDLLRGLAPVVARIALEHAHGFQKPLLEQLPLGLFSRSRRRAENDQRQCKDRQYP